jgi:hypothetical protein
MRHIQMFILVKNYLFIFPSLSIKSLCGLQVKMGTSQSRYKDKNNDIEEGGKMVQNVNKIKNYLSYVPI